MRIVKMIRNEPVKWVVIMAVNGFACRAIYLDTKDTRSWQSTVAISTLGFVLSLVMLAYVVEPLLQYVYSRTSTWFTTKK